MSEYIEREAVMGALFHEQYGYLCEDAINSIPAADVRPVVLCRDCEHNNHCLTQEFVDDCGKIPLDRNTFFCADGERRSNA